MPMPLPVASVPPPSGLSAAGAPRPSHRLIALARSLEHLLDDPGVGADEIAVFVALARHVDDAGTCHPSQGTIADYLQRSRPWVNARVRRLGDLGLVNWRRHYLAKGGETSCRYHLPLLDVTGATAGRVPAALAPPSVTEIRHTAINDDHPSGRAEDATGFHAGPVSSEPSDVGTPAERAGQGGDLETASCPPSVCEIGRSAVRDGDTACPGGETSCRADDTNRLNTTPASHRPDGAHAREATPAGRDGPATDRETEALVGRIQQAAATPWRLENARRVVIAAIRGAGRERVSALAAAIRGAGLRPWQIINRLQAPSDPTRRRRHPPLRPLQPRMRPLPTRPSNWRSASSPVPTSKHG